MRGQDRFHRSWRETCREESCVCVQISECVWYLLRGESGPASSVLLEWLNVWKKAGTVGHWKTGLTWTTFRQHEGELLRGRGASPLFSEPFGATIFKRSGAQVVHERGCSCVSVKQYGLWGPAALTASRNPPIVGHAHHVDLLFWAFDFLLPHSNKLASH